MGVVQLGRGYTSMEETSKPVIRNFFFLHLDVKRSLQICLLQIHSLAAAGSTRAPLQASVFWELTSK